jgi:hypothetical protein
VLDAVIVVIENLPGQFARDKASLDIQWLHADASKPNEETPQALITEILQDLGEAMKEFAAAEAQIRRRKQGNRHHVP